MPAYYNVALTLMITLDILMIIVLRVDVCKYRESDDRTKISNLFLFYQMNLFSDLFSKMGLKGLISFLLFSKFQ